MKITTYQQLDILVAQSLGWVESTHLESQSEPIPDVEIEFYHPPDLADNELEDWFSGYGVAPEFSECWGYVEEFLLPECDRLDCIIELVRSKEAITCQIKPKNPELWTSKHFTPITVGLDGTPNSMPLATCLAWLHFKGVEFELELSNESTQS